MALALYYPRDPRDPTSECVFLALYLNEEDTRRSPIPRARGAVLRARKLTGDGDPPQSVPRQDVPFDPNMMFGVYDTNWERTSGPQARAEDLQAHLKKGRRLVTGPQDLLAPSLDSFAPRLIAEGIIRIVG